MKITFVSRGRFIPSATEAKIQAETFDNTLTDFGERARRLDRKERDPIRFLTFPLTFLYVNPYTGKCYCRIAAAISSQRYNGTLSHKLYEKLEASSRISSSRDGQEFRVE